MKCAVLFLVACTNTATTMQPGDDGGDGSPGETAELPDPTATCRATVAMGDNTATAFVWFPGAPAAEGYASRFVVTLADTNGHLTELGGGVAPDDACDDTGGNLPTDVLCWTPNGRWGGTVGGLTGDVSVTVALAGRPGCTGWSITTD